KRSPGLRRFRFWSRSRRLFESRVLPPEQLHAARAIHQPLLAGEERVAARADFEVQEVALIGRAGLEGASACAHDGHFVIVRMDARFHGTPSRRTAIT